MLVGAFLPLFSGSKAERAWLSLFPDLLDSWILLKQLLWGLPIFYQVSSRNKSLKIYHLIDCQQGILTPRSIKSAVADSHSFDFSVDLKAQWFSSWSPQLSVRNDDPCKLPLHLIKTRHIL